MELRRIAYVEDERDIRDLTEIALTSIGGFEVATFASGEEALAGLPAFAPDLIVLDVMMPGMNGKDLFRRLSGSPSLRDVPVIFMTAKSLKSEMAELREMGGIGIVSKPYDPMTLSDEIRGVWDRHAAA